MTVMKQFEVKRKQIEYLSMFFEIVILWIIAGTIGMEGMGFFLVAWILYVILWAVLAESFPDAIGKMIRFRKSKGQYKSILGLKRLALFWQLLAGLFGSLLLFFLSGVLAENVFHSAYSKLMIWILAPLVLLRAMSALFLGFFQGEGTELPAVAAAVLRPLLTYVFGIFFSGSFQKYGEKVSMLLKQERYTAMYAGAGWCLAMTMAEVIILLLSILEYLRIRRKRRDEESEGRRSDDDLPALLRTLFGNMGGKVAIRLLEIFPVIAGMILYYSRTKDNAMAGFGSYFTGYLSVCLAVVFLLNAVTVPLWGKVAAFRRRDEKRMACVSFQGGIHLLFALGFWLSAGFSVLAVQVGSLVGFTSPNLVKIVVPGSFWILFAAMSFYFSRMLMRLGKGMIAIGMALLCDVLFLLLFLILWSNASMGILAFLYASLISEGVQAVLLGALCAQLLGLKMEWLKVFGMPFFAGAAAALPEFLAAKFLTVYLGNALTVLIAGGAGFLVFLCILLFLRNFDEEELDVIPLGRFLHSFGSMLNVF